MTPEEFKTYTGLTATYSGGEWEKLVDVAKARLASFLCLEKFPELNDQNHDLAMLLASFIAAVIRFQGDGTQVSSKSVRNFTISFQNGTAADAFSQIAQQYGDIIDKYSHCDLGVAVEKARRCGYGVCVGL